MKARQMQRRALDTAETIFSRTLDFTLWYVAYVSLLPIAFSLRQPQWKAEAEASAIASAINYDRIKRAIIQARHKRLIEKSKRHAWPVMTEAGKRRLSAIVPEYDANRTWDGRLHLVTYDIAEKKCDDRRLLRDFLRRIGCARLQDSVWLTPYNPIDLVRSFAGDHHLQGAIIVSDIGKDGAVGEESVSDLIVRVYALEKLNDRYSEWIAQTDRGGTIDHDLLLSYLAILKDDPQLPFRLLPPWWKGSEAYRLAEHDLKKISLFFRPEK